MRDGESFVQVEVVHATGNYFQYMYYSMMTLNLSSDNLSVCILKLVHLLQHFPLSCIITIYLDAVNCMPVSINCLHFHCVALLLPVYNSFPCLIALICKC